MRKKIINVELSTSSIDNAIKELTEIRKKYIKWITEDFIYESLEWIKNQAIYYHTIRTINFPNTANINKDWHIKKVFKNKNNMCYELRNDNELVAYVEFGTGLVGDTLPHKVAKEVNYDYDMNNHGIEGWSFKNEDFSLYFIDFIGYEGQSFLYDAFYDYFYGNKWKDIFEENYNKHIK